MTESQVILVSNSIEVEAPGERGRFAMMNRPVVHIELSTISAVQVGINIEVTLKYGLVCGKEE